MKRPSVVVVGDALLDVDVRGTSGRLVPDSAAAVVDVGARDVRAGGAALAAAFAADDGVDVTLVTTLPGASGEQLRTRLDPRLQLLELPGTGEVGSKTRVLVGRQVVARLDEGGDLASPTATPDALRGVLERADAVLVSDYGRGVAAAPGVRALLERAAPTTPVVWDPHPRGPAPVPGARVVTPNAGEAARADGTAPADGFVAAAAQAHRLAERWRVRAVAVTLGGSGAVLAHDGDTRAFPLERASDGDPCGAGDRFAARVASACAGGALPTEAVGSAVGAAAAFVASRGARPGVTADAPVSAQRSADELVAQVRAAGGTVVATGGCFDLLHAGHVATLAAARRMGDCLVVLLNSDASVRRRKGPQRPLQREEDRAALLAGLRCVDAVVIFDEDTPERALARLRPDLWVKGGDYCLESMPEASLVRSWGGRVITLPYLPGRSTTELVDRSAGVAGGSVPR